MSSFKISLQKALLMSNCLNGHPLARATMRTMQIVVGLTTRLKVLEKSTSLLVESLDHQSSFI